MNQQKTNQHVTQAIFSEKQSNSGKGFPRLTMIAATLALLAIICIGMVTALEITSPSGTVYATGNETAEVQLSVNNDNALYALWYKLDASGMVLACVNCAEYNKTLSVTPGNHTFTVVGVQGFQLFDDTVAFTVARVDGSGNNTNSTNNTSNNTNTPSFRLDITSPENKVYTTNSINLSIASNATIDSIAYSIDNGATITACTNCSSHAGVISANDGVHNIVAFGTLGTVVLNDSISFMVNTSTAGNASNNTNNTNTTPTNKKPVIRAVGGPTKLKIGETGTWIVRAYDPDGSYLLYNVDWGDEDIMPARTNIAGTASITQQSRLQHSYDKAGYYVVLFSVEDEHGLTANASLTVYVYDTNMTKINYTDNSTRLTRSEISRLPKLLEQGKITDAELAAIIRSNTISPGIIVRLIKTELLGEESISAILDTQFTSPGVIKKLFEFAGLGEDSYAYLIYKHYNLSTKNEQKLLFREDLSDDDKEDIQERLEGYVSAHSKDIKEKNKDEYNESSGSSGDDDKESDDDSDDESVSIGRQVVKENVPKGLAKKMTASYEDDDDRGKDKKKSKRD